MKSSAVSTMTITLVTTLLGCGLAERDAVAQAPPTAPAEMSFQADDKPPSIEEMEKDVKPLTAEERASYERVALALVTAINAEDRAAYRALHTHEAWNTAIDWWRNLFAIQTAKWGRIDRAWPPTRGVVRVGGLGFRGSNDVAGATVVVRFEDGMGGALTFTLDENGKISSTSVFIKDELGLYEPEDTKPIYPPANAD